MKELIYTLVLGATLLFSSCGEDASKNATNNNNNSQAELEQKRLDSLRILAETKKRDSINSLLSSIDVKLFEHTGLDFYEGCCANGVQMDKARVIELKKFNNTKKHNCGKGRYIQKISIDGTFDKINIQFLDSKGNILEEMSQYPLNGSVEFTTENLKCGDCMESEIKDKNYKAWFEKAAKLNLSYQDSIFYSAEWNSSATRFRDL